MDLLYLILDFSNQITARCRISDNYTGIIEDKTFLISTSDLSDVTNTLSNFQ